MESTDDDISILSSHDAIDGSTGDINSRILPQEFVISRSPGFRPDPAVQALQQAYSDLKKRYNETVTKNQQMSRALRDVERLKMSDHDMTYPHDSLNSQGAAATAEFPHRDMDTQQRIILLEARLQSMTSLKGSYEENARHMQQKLQEIVYELKQKEEEARLAKEENHELKSENLQLRDDIDNLRRRAMDMQDQMRNSIPHSSLEKQNRDFEEMQIKYQLIESQLKDLKTESDRLKVSEGIAQNDLGSANKRIAELEEINIKMNSKCQMLEDELKRRPDSANSDLQSTSLMSSISTTEELSHLKKVIHDLRRQAEQQRECLRRIDKNGTIMNSATDFGFGSQRRLAPEEQTLGSSWENVPSSPAGPVYVKDGISASPRRISQPQSSSNSTPRRSNSTNSSSGSTPIREQSQSQSEVLRRRASENVLTPRSQSEVLARAHDLRESSPLGDVTWRQQTVNNVNHMNGGTTQFQSSYDNTPPRRTAAPLSVISDTFSSEVDNTPAFPVPPECRPTIVSQENSNGETGEKVCPVCSRDFTSMPMEDFQTHVFECFDDQSAPETLRAVSATERICPMCNALFPEAVPQGDFEKHVQGHFEAQDITDRFEVINP